MRKQLKAEQAKVADCKKEIANLQTKLHAETAGYSHLRDDGTTTDEAVVSFAVQFKIYRGHFQKLRGMLEHDRMIMTDKLVGWYAEWKKSPNEKVVIVDADKIDVRRNGIGGDLDEDYD
jgi:hypothetical protein